MDEPGSHQPIGEAFRARRTADGLADFRLRVAKVELSGLYLCVGRRFLPLGDAAEVLPGGGIISTRLMGRAARLARPPHLPRGGRGDHGVRLGAARVRSGQGSRQGGIIRVASSGWHHQGGIRACRAAAIVHPCPHLGSGGWGGTGSQG